MEKEKAIKHLEVIKGDCALVGDIHALDMAISALKGGWIPVEERKPTEDGEYLLWGRICEDEESDYQFIGNYDTCVEKFGDWENYYDSSTLGFLDSELQEYHEVLAWQPLPEPYKAEKGGE